MTRVGPQRHKKKVMDLGENRVMLIPLIIQLEY